MPKYDALSTRMKLYEMPEAGRRLMPLLPICIRLDGNNFSKFTQGLARPYDARLSGLMVRLTNYLVRETGATIGYTQSDEISLVCYSDVFKCQPYFDGRVQKIESILAAKASVFFNSLLGEFLPEKAGLSPVFDCRCWNVPTKTEAANTLLWREKDATRNSISMAAQEHYTHIELFKKSTNEKQEMLLARGINWNDYPSFFKRGVFVRKQTTLRSFTMEELDGLPEKHAARHNKDLLIERSEIMEISMPPFGQVLNREAVIFDGEAPVRGEV